VSRSDPDATRIVRLWLEEGVTALPDHVLDAVLNQLPATSQRQLSWLARRSPIMNNTIRLIAAAAAVAVATLIGYQLLIAPNVGGPGPAPIESPSAPPTATLAPSVGTGSVFPPPGPLEAGTRYAVPAPAPGSRAVSYSFAVPTSGWNSGGEFTIDAGGFELAAEASVWFFDNYSLFEDDGRLPMIPAVLDDPCVHDGLQSQSFEASLAGQAEALASMPGTELVSGPSDVTLDTRSSRRVTIDVPDEVGCAREEFWLLFNQSAGPDAFYPNWLGETIHAWLIDVDGEIFNIWAQVRPGDAIADLEAEIQQIVDSIQFE
jgi:hypothetical protein